jgi:chloramphenicol-sensitive protein RarD
MREEQPASGKGFAYAVAAYGSWGLLPLFWKLLGDIDAVQILSCRVVFSLILVWIILALRGKPAWPRLLADRRARRSLIVSSAFIAVNWGLYIWAVNSGHTVDASLGYYINPLVNVLLGLFFFRERMRPLQWAAFGLAAAGVILLTLQTGGFPWIALSLAGTFGFYGFAKKSAGIDSLEGLGAETLLIAPLAAAYLAFRHAGGEGAFQGPALRSALLVASGVVTALPLYWFARGAKLLPLSLMGFVQYISPTLQLAAGVFLFGEAFPASRLTAFALVWAGLIAYSLSFFPSRRARERPSAADRAPTR